MVSKKPAGYGISKMVSNRSAKYRRSEGAVTMSEVQQQAHSVALRIVLKRLSYRVGFYDIRRTLVSDGASDRGGFISGESLEMSSEQRSAGRSIS